MDHGQAFSPDLPLTIFFGLGDRTRLRYGDRSKGGHVDEDPIPPCSL